MARWSLYALSIIGWITLASTGSLAQVLSEEELPDTVVQELSPNADAPTPTDSEDDATDEPSEATETPTEDPESDPDAVRDTDVPSPEDALIGEFIPEAPSENDTPAAPELCLAIVDAAGYGVHPVVAEHMTTRMRTRGAQMGYRILPRSDTVAAARRVRMSYPPDAGDLWRAAFAADCHRIAFARVWARQGRYEYQLMVGSLDGSGPFVGQGAASAQELLEHLDTELQRRLPAPSDWDQTRYDALTSNVEMQPVAAAAAQAAPEPPPEPPPPFVGRRFQLAFSSESAIGTSDDGFYNHLLGVRADYRLSPKVLLGAYMGYVNLNGRNSRVSNVLTYAQIETRIRFRARQSITLPIRFGFGYLPLNGPFIRMSAGLNFPISDRLELGVDLLAPTFWVLPSSTPISLNLSAEIILRI